MFCSASILKLALVCRRRWNRWIGSPDLRKVGYQVRFSMLVASKGFPSPLRHPFTNEQSYYPWSSTTYPATTDYAWVMRMDFGLMFSYNK